MTWHYACTLCFSNDDFYRRKIKDAHPVVREKFREWDDELDEDQEIAYLLSPADKVRRRMHIQGYTDERCLALWNREYPRHIANLEEMQDKHGIDLSKEIAAQKGLSFDKWLERANALSLDHLIMSGGVTEFDLTDMFANLALEIQYFKPKQVWTELGSNADYFDPKRTFHENFASVDSFDDMDQDYIQTTENILILTEGRSDTQILSVAINAMYPEYADLFQFVDFDEFSISGGASMLTKMVKSFAGVRMKQPILALFDNDAAGIAEKNHVENIRALPPTIKAMVLPDLELANNYPTIGPEGSRHMNVNGSASSIELFLGREALTDKGEELHPIRWASWNNQIKRYQGALEYKDSIAQRFLSRMKIGGEPAELRAKFADMDQLLNAIFRAFH